MWLRNDRIIMNVPGATTGVATLKKALSEAENNAAKERTEREKQEARVGKVQQELQALVKKHETLELDSKTRESELAAPLESTKHAKAEAQKALQEIEAVRKIAAGKAFSMQSRHIKVNYLLLTRIRSSQGHSQIFPAAYPMPPHSTEPRKAARRRRCSGLSTLRLDTMCP